MYHFSPFRNNYTAQPQNIECPFCATQNLTKQTIINSQGKMFENDHWMWLVNLYPKFEGHTMLVPKRHFTDLTEETVEETLSRQSLFNTVIPILRQAFPDHGIEYFAQNGTGSASSVSHIHWHLVPASPDDELRSFEKLGHFYTTKPEEEKVLIFPKTITMDPEELRNHLSSF